MMQHTRNHALPPGWAPRCGIVSPHRASQQASGARQWVARLGTLLLLASPLHVLSAVLEYGDPQGWQWYNEPQDDEEQPRQVSPQTHAPRSATELKKQLQRATEEAKDRAILFSSPDNFAKYMRWQNFWTDRAGAFTQSAKQAMLKYPELDYNLQYSYYNGTVEKQMEIDRNKEKNAIAKIAGSHGIFFFYRGNMPIDNLMGSIVSNFAKENNLSIIPITVDGKINPYLPNSKLDNGQRKSMGVKFFPALFLVNPKNETYQPLAYGFMTADALSKQFLNITTDFKGEY